MWCSGMLRGVEGRQREAGEGGGGGGGGGDAADDDGAGREKWIRKVKAFCQDGRLLAAAAHEGQREGVDGDGEGVSGREIVAGRRGGAGGGGTEEMAEAMAACVLLWGGLEAEATPTAIAMEYGRLSSALHDLSAHELFEVSCVLGFQVEEDLGGGGGWRGGGEAEGGDGREASRWRGVSGDDLRGVDGEGFGEALRHQLAIALVSPCQANWGLPSRHIPTPRAKSNLQLERSSCERKGERKSGSQRGGGDGGDISLLHLY
jgi:hypothetical protein